MINAFTIDFWNKIVLEEVYIEDQKSDSLLYLNQLTFGIVAFDWDKKTISCDIDLEQLKLRVRRENQEEDFNYEFILNHFESEDTTTSSWDFQLKQLLVNNSAISWHDKKYEEDTTSFDVDHFDLSALNIKADNFEFDDERFSVAIHKLAVIEKKGFDLQQFKTDLSIDSGTIHLKDLELYTDHTDLTTDFYLIAPSFDAYSEFNKEVVMQADVESFLLYTPDLAYFAPFLKGMEEKVYAEGKMKGTVSNLAIEDLEVFLNPLTRLSGDVSMRGLPELDNTFIFFEVDELLTTSDGLRQIPSIPFNQGGHLEIPEEIDQLGEIYFNGNFTGYINDFVSFGKFNTDLGKVITDLSLTTNDEKVNQYQGKLGTADFDLGTFLGIKDLGQVNFDLNLNGEGITKEKVSATAQGAINNVTYKGYTYKNILLNGDFNHQTFIGSFNVTDENLALSFLGKIDLDSRTPLSQFSLDVRNAKLAKLNLFNQKDSTTSLSFRSNIDLRGNSIDNFTGTALIGDLRYTDEHLNHQMTSLELIASHTKGERSIDINSTLLDASLKGVYKLNEFESIYHRLIDNHIPNSNYSHSEISQQYFHLTIDFKDTRPFTEVVLPELSIGDNTSLQLDYNTEKDRGILSISGSKLRYQNSSLENYILNAVFVNDSLSMNFSSDQSDWFGLEEVHFMDLNTSMNGGIGNNIINWKGIGNDFGVGHIELNNQIRSINDVDFSFENTSFEVNDSIWAINDGNKIHLDSSILSFDGFNLKNGYQLINISGIASSNKTDTLQLLLREIDLEFISSLLPEGTVELKGVANGKASVVSMFDQLSLTTDLRLNNLFINTVKIGQSTLSSTWVADRKALLIEGTLGEPSSDLLTLSGEVFPLKESNSLDLRLNLNQFPMRLIQPYVQDYLSEIEGVISGKIKVVGEASMPIMEGDLQFINSKFKVDYLNTYYSINDQLFIKPDYIGFNLIEIKDSKGNKAIATGTVFHENYSNLNYDIGLEFKDFFSLNTTSEDNDLFYGVAHTTGSANIAGYDDHLALELELKTEKGTDFKIPLEEGVDISSSNFLIFTNSPEYNQEIKEELDLSGIEMRFDLDITPDAQIQIIFDEQVGDVMKAEGKGEMKLEINTLGDFNIYGQYVVEKGDYLFTLQNIINKRFNLANGSTIYWDGDPYKATLDMQAIYNLRAPLYDLFPEDSTAAYKRRIPVELELQLTNYLLSPDIGFDIRLPTADENTKQRLESILYVNNEDVNRQEMNQQVFGLLLLNRFLPSTVNSTATDTYSRGTPGINNGYEFLSNQLSNWFSRLSDQFDVGVNYRPADELNSNEVDLSLSTQILDDRLTLDGNFGFSGQSPQQINNQNSGFIGEFTAEYKLSKDGRYKVKGFNRSVSNGLLQLNSPYTQGVGLFYREEFDTAQELWRKYFKSSSKK